MKFEVKCILFASACGFVGGFFSGVAGSARPWINMIVGGLMSAILAYLFKGIIVPEKNKKTNKN